MASKNQMGRMLTVREVSQLLHVHSNTLRRWSKQGIIRAYRVGPCGHRSFRAEDVAGLLLEENKGFRVNGGKKNLQQNPQGAGL